MDGEYPDGGSRELARLIDRYGEVLITDLKHYYGIDLRDLFSEVDPLSPRWVLAHVIYLPVESAYVAEQRGGQRFRGWDESRYQTASLINEIRLLRHIYVVSHTEKNKPKPKPPEPWPLPDGKPKKADTPNSFAGMAKSMLARAKQKRKGRA